MRVITTLLGLSAFSVVCAGAATAAEIYRWVGADGVVHYSDEKPRDEADFTTVEVTETTPDDYDPLTDPWSIQNQAKRMNESWSILAREREARLEARRQATQNVQLGERAPTQQRLEYGTRYYSPWFWSTPARLLRQQRVDPRTAQRQLHAIQGLDLSGQRPASINSGVHRDRVQRSEALALTGTTPNRRP
ncbi:MAG: DUF4124 domain-containing protein [Gammaproteobacteria bacterium]|jgi:hypothetical protein